MASIGKKRADILRRASHATGVKTTKQNMRVLESLRDDGYIKRHGSYGDFYGAQGGKVLPERFYITTRGEKALEDYVSRARKQKMTPARKRKTLAASQCCKDLSGGNLSITELLDCLSDAIKGK